MTDPVSISKDIYDMIQDHARKLSNDNIKNQPEHLDNLESLIKVAKDDWKRKNPN